MALKLSMCKVRTLGRRRGLKVVRMLLENDHLTPLKTLHNIHQTLGAFDESNSDALLIPRKIPLPSLMLLHQCAVERGFCTGLGVSDSLEVKGIVITRLPDTGETMEVNPSELSYSHHLYANYLALCPIRGLQTALITSDEIFSLLNQCRLQELRKLQQFPDEILECTLGFLNGENDIDFSDRLIEWLFLESVLVIPNSSKLQRDIQSAAHEYESLVKNVKHNRKRWPFFFGHEVGRTMFWPGSKVFKTISYPPLLKNLHDSLTESFPTLAKLTPDLLPTWYKTGKIKLTYHQDKFGQKFFGRRELVILMFEGTPRELSIKLRNFERKLLCTSCSTIILTPCANDYFHHAKLPTRLIGHSITFAFRRGLPPNVNLAHA